MFDLSHPEIKPPRGSGLNLGPCLSTRLKGAAA